MHIPPNANSKHQNLTNISAFLDYSHNPPFHAMRISILLLCLVSIPFFSHAAPAKKGYLLNCGAKEAAEFNGLKYIPDDDFIPVGNSTVLQKQPDDLVPILATLRYFPVTEAKKYCYNFLVDRGAKYLVRTTYFFGNFDNNHEPPVFDQIIDGTKCSLINTTEEYASGQSSYYEIILTAQAKSLCVCLARNERTKSPPFISAIEVQKLEDPVYNGTDFSKYGLITVARSSFGNEFITYPDDIYNRFWHPFVDHNMIETSKSVVNSSDFWNKPPAKLFDAALTTSRGKALTMKWPPFKLPTSHYYIVLYFKDSREHNSQSYRNCDVTVNGDNFYKDLVITSMGVAVYGKDWPLSDETEIVMNSASDSLVSPIINGGEVFRLLPMASKTLPRDVIVMESMAKSFENPPPDWIGDPCMPKSNTWTGVLCSGRQTIRVVSINLSNYGLRGTLPRNLDKLTALNELLLEGNNLTGTIPEMGSLQALESLHLEGNQLEGPIPESLRQLPNLEEIELKNNHLTGEMPRPIAVKSADKNNAKVTEEDSL